MTGWTTDNDDWRRKRLARPRSHYLKSILTKLVFWMDDRMWQWRGFPKRQVYRLTYKLYWKVQWPDDRSEAYPPAPW